MLHNQPDLTPDTDTKPDTSGVPSAYRAIWPLGALIVAELLAGIFLNAGDWPINPVLLMIALAVLLAGIVPALLRPAGATNLLGCLAVALACVFWYAPGILNSAPSFTDIAHALVADEQRLLLINSVLVAPLTLHLAACFPQQGMLSRRSLFGYDLVLFVIVLALVGLPVPMRGAILDILLLTLNAGFVLAGWQSVQAIRIVTPASPHATQQARLVLLSIITAETPLLLLPISELLHLNIPIEFVLIAQTMLPLGIAGAMLRPDIFGINAGIRRMLNFAVVSFGLLLIYAGLNVILTQIGRSMGVTWGFAITVLTVIPAAAAFLPLQRGIQRITDQLFYPERLAFGRAIGAAQTTLALVVQRDAVTTLLEQTFPHQLGATWARLVLRPSFDQPATAAQPGVWSMLLMVNGQPLGCYWLGPRHSGLKYASDEQEQLRGFIQQAALALAYADTFDTLVHLNHELEERVATRTEHVLAQQRELATLEERQRLARDLHDSVKQTLFSLGLGLRSARGRVRSDPDAAVALLQQQEQVAILAQAELGDLLAQLRTPIGDSADLVAILEQHANWLMQQHGLLLTLDTPAALVLPEPLPRELAQIAKEGLHNVLRHSGTNAAQLTLTSDNGQICLTITDHGQGFDSTLAHAGYGLRGMHERVLALGGRLTIQTAPGKGTTLWLHIPLVS
jgi:signal transduction histidine kinase